MAMFALMEKALIGIETHDVNRRIEMVIEERVSQAQQGIHRVGRRMGLTALKAEVCLQKRPEHPGIERCGSPLIAHELLQCGSRGDFGEQRFYGHQVLFAFACQATLPTPAMCVPTRTLRHASVKVSSE